MLTRRSFLRCVQAFVQRRISVRTGVSESVYQFNESVIDLPTV